VATSRETALTALFDRLASAYAWKTSSRRFLMWTEVPAGQRPAMYQLESGTEEYQWSSLAVPRRQINVKIFIYTSADHTAPGATIINNVLDAVDAALAPAGRDLQHGRQTLGDLVHNCRVTSVPVRDTGDVDGDGLVVIGIQLTMP
jgi:hypothetical protein